MGYLYLYRIMLLLHTMIVMERRKNNKQKQMAKQTVKVNGIIKWRSNIESQN